MQDHEQNQLLLKNHEYFAKHRIQLVLYIGSPRMHERNRLWTSIPTYVG